VKALYSNDSTNPAIAPSTNPSIATGRRENRRRLEQKAGAGKHCHCKDQPHLHFLDSPSLDLTWKANLTTAGSARVRRRTNIS